MLRSVRMRKDLFSHSLNCCFSGMLQIRIGWLAHAMRLLLRHKSRDCKDAHECDIHDLSPSGIKLLMHEALTFEQHQDLTWLQQKQIAGALNRVRSVLFGAVLIGCKSFIIGDRVFLNCFGGLKQSPKFLSTISKCILRTVVIFTYLAKITFELKKFIRSLISGS